MFKIFKKQEEKKDCKILKKAIFLDSFYKDNQLFVVLKKEKSDTNEGYLVEARLMIPGNDLFAKEYGPKFEVAAENACLDLERQLRKRKTKLASKTRARKVKAKAADEELE